MWTEYACNPQNTNQFNSAGTVELNTDRVRVRQSGKVILLKLIGLLVMVGIGLTIIVNTLPFSGWRSIALSLLVLTVYVTTAYFVRPEPNTDNMGWGGMFDDKFQYNDDINRSLFKMQCMLGPGRFVSETILEACVHCGLISERTEQDVAVEQQAKSDNKMKEMREEITSRVKTRREETQLGNGEMQLDSMKYFNQSS